MSESVAIPLEYTEAPYTMAVGQNSCNKDKHAGANSNHDLNNRVLNIGKYKNFSSMVEVKLLEDN